MEEVTYIITQENPFDPACGTRASHLAYMHNAFLCSGNTGECIVRAATVRFLNRQTLHAFATPVELLNHPPPGETPLQKSRSAPSPDKQGEHPWLSRRSMVLEQGSTHNHGGSACGQRKDVQFGRLGQRCGFVLCLRRKAVGSWYSNCIYITSVLKTTLPKPGSPSDPHLTWISVEIIVERSLVFHPMSQLYASTNPHVIKIRRGGGE